MDDGLKKRLIGAAVLASLAVIFVPMLFEDPPAKVPPLPPLPESAPVRDFASEMLREEIPVITPLAPPTTAQPTTEEQVVLPPASANPPVDSPPAETTAAEVPADAPASDVGLMAWVVQAASLSSQENADKLVAKLRAAELPTPDPELVEVQGKRYYRVQVGPVIERSDAEAMRDRVSEVAGTQAQVRQYP